ncbi:MAG: thioesterase domain-containing protein [Microcoleaceae cyanobacterium]
MNEKQLSSLRIEDIAGQFIQDMRHIQPEGPYLIGAYCGDAKIAFEMAQQLYSQGQKVAQLAFIDVVWNPQNVGSNLYWQNFRKFGFEYLRKKIRGKLNLTIEKIVKLINQTNKSFNSKIDENLDIKIKHEKLLQAFYKARKIYVPQSYSGQVALFLSREWQLKNSSELANLVDGELEMQEVPEYHNFLFEKPYV